MSSDFEKTANELQESITEDARKIYLPIVISKTASLSLKRERQKFPEAVSKTAN